MTIDVTSERETLTNNNKKYVKNGWKEIFFLNTFNDNQKGTILYFLNVFCIRISSKSEKDEISDQLIRVGDNLCLFMVF